MQNALSGILKELQIELVLFDVDDTLVETYNHFDTARTNIKRQLAQACKTSFEEISQLYDQLNQQARELYHVDPIKVWKHIFNGIKEIYPGSDWFLIDEYLKEYTKILYELPIPLKPGVIEILTAIKEAGISMGIVTNADSEWTIRKLKNVGILEYFDPSRIEIIPPEQKKDLTHWQQAMHKVNPAQVLALGDNFPVDIKPCIELGAYTILINDPNHLPASFSDGYAELASKTIRISSYNEIVKALQYYKEISINDLSLGLK